MPQWWRVVANGDGAKEDVILGRRLLHHQVDIVHDDGGGRTHDKRVGRNCSTMSFGGGGLRRHIHTLKV